MSETELSIITPPMGPEPPLKVLIVDDEQAVLRALQRELRGLPVSVDTFNDPLKALEAVKREAYALVITDNRMPGMTGVELLRRLKEISPDTSRIVLTGYSDLESTVKAINEGETNYFLGKPWKREELHKHVALALEKYRLRISNNRLADELSEKNQQLERSNELLRILATRDRMTGLFNHAEFQSALERQIKLFRRDRRPFCLAMGDIDNFKSVNDTHGHATGDAVIKAIGQILQNSLREEVDTSYRYGGEEFAVLMRNTTEEQGHLVMTRILARIAGTPVPASAAKLCVTMSIGVGEFAADCTGAEFLSRVDRTLYAAKDGGKNRVNRLSELPPAVGERG